MEVHVAPPSPATDFHDSLTTTPYATAPSSPQSTIPFTWEEKPGIPKHNLDYSEQQQQLQFEQNYEDTDFAFGYLERHSISAADELFDDGKIKPLKPPPRLHVFNDSPRSPKSPKSPKMRIKEALSPKSRKDEFDPFSEAFKQTSCEQRQTDDNHQERGRERMTKNVRHKISRSLSPFRIADIVNNCRNSKDQSSSSTGLTWYNKWNLRNLLLFRSVSEGSATTRKKGQSFSFRSTDGGGSIADDDVAEEMRKKSSLPYKSGLMGCLRFNQNAGSVHEISRGINAVMKQ